jgi:chromosome segregation protein
MLQERLQYVVVPDADAGVAGSQYLRDTETGRAGFIPRAPRSLFRDVSEHVRMDLAPLSNYVSVPPEYREMLAHLFDGVVVVDSLESAAHHWKAEDSRVTYVTREGESLDPAGIITGGSGDPGQAGLLARKAELKELEIALCSAENNVQQADEAYNRAVRDTDSVAARLSTLDQKLHALTLCRVSSEGEAELHRQGLIRTEERLRNVDTDLRTNVEERRLLDERETSIRADLTDALEQLQRAEVCRDGLVAELAELEARHKDSLATVGSLRLEETALRERRETCEVRLQATKLAIGELAQRLEVLAGRLNRDSAELTATEKRLNDPVLSIEQAQRTCEGAQNDSAAADATAKDLRTEIEALERSLATINTEIDSIREQRARSELEGGRDPEESGRGLGAGTVRRRSRFAPRRRSSGGLRRG